LLKQSYDVLNNLRLKNGLYVASPSKQYNYVWIRDCVYISMPFVNKKNNIYEKTYYRLFDLFKEYEWKIDIVINQKPHQQWEYLHARYSAQEVKEIHDQEWGHSQHDMIGAFLFGIGKGIEKNKKMIRDQKDISIIKKLVSYLESVEYWKDEDCGMWEEWCEVHSSSVGACVAGLKSIKNIVDVPNHLIENGLNTLKSIFPRESNDKMIDLSQLSLIYPYNLFTKYESKVIIDNVEKDKQAKICLKCQNKMMNEAVYGTEKSGCLNCGSL
jgi:phosphorylase kinase alpha/beta subunit